ncbi:MAG: 2-oxo acid dehydrogenase subunit E2 [Rhizobiales bacterium]|nr:2-oxo acid dehydrogenase subunit E2 [Hyphomicrobiales bacterium]
MPVEVILPRVDMDMTTGTISRWYVKDGDSVRKGTPIFEIETDKAAMEVESPGDGIIRYISAGEGAVVPVGEPVAFIYGAGEVQTAPSPSKVAKTEAAEPVADTLSSPVATRYASMSIDVAGKRRATPLARSLARNAGVDIATVKGSGPHDRIVAADVTAAIEAAKRPQAIQKPAAVQPQSISDDAIRALYPSDAYDFVAHGNMRRTIAQRLVQSKQTVPHFYLSVACEVTQLNETRTILNDRAPKIDGAPSWKLSVNDFVIKALALALRDVPDANVTWTDAGMLRHRTSDISVAVAVEGGLFTPVIRAAETKSLSAISREMKDLAARARAGKLQPGEYQGGTASISNLGMYGIESFSAIINPPQATILAVGAAIERPIARNGAVIVAPVMDLTLSCDHRAVDGAVGARLLAAVKAYLEEPSLMLA